MDNRKSIVGRGMEGPSRMCVDLDANASALGSKLQPELVQPRSIDLEATAVCGMDGVGHRRDEGRLVPGAHPKRLALAPASAAPPEVIKGILQQDSGEAIPHHPPATARGRSISSSSGLTPASLRLLLVGSSVELPTA